MIKLKPHAVSKRRTIASILTDQTRHMLIFFTPRHICSSFSLRVTYAHLFHSASHVLIFFTLRHICSSFFPIGQPLTFPAQVDILFKRSHLRSFFSGNIFIGECIFRAQELCESRGGRPGLPSLLNLRFLWT